ncbi:MAG: leucine-rich repeat domain-containing protein [Bacteroidales bacterium]|nr:leucine-rich repeat domain-containing protein [Bacteroidales bacterium]
MKTSLITRIAIVAVLMSTFCANTFAQVDNREWWNSLTPAWKKVFRDIELKGKDVEPTDEQLQSMVLMENVECGGNKEIEDLRGLSRLTNLKTIDCSNTNITSLDGIQTLTGLIELDCSNNDNINSLKPITGLINLERLNCGNTMVKSLAPLTYLKKLRRLDAHYCTVNNLGQIGDLKSLTYLDLSDNHSLFSLAGIEKLTQLVELNCNNTNISDLGPLSNMKVIESLSVANTRVTTLRPLQFVRSLKEIDCSGTKIAAASLDYFTSHTHLKFLRGRDLDIDQKDIDAFIASFAKRVPECDVILQRK